MPSPPGVRSTRRWPPFSDGWTVIWRRRRQAPELSEARGRSHPPHGGDWLLRVLPGRGGSGTGGDIRQVADDWPGPRGECGNRRRYRDSPPAATTVGPPRWRRSNSYHCTTALQHYRTNCTTALSARRWRRPNFWPPPPRLFSYGW